jgi:hypothetical protein
MNDSAIDYDTRKKEAARVGVCATLAGAACVLQVPIFFFRMQIVRCIIEIAPSTFVETVPTGETHLRFGLASGIILLPSIAAILLAFSSLVWERPKISSRPVAMICGFVGLSWILMRLWGAFTEYFRMWELHTRFWEWQYMSLP